MGGLQGGTKTVVMQGDDVEWSWAYMNASGVVMAERMKDVGCRVMMDKMSRRVWRDGGR